MFVIIEPNVLYTGCAVIWCLCDRWGTTCTRRRSLSLVHPHVNLGKAMAQGYQSNGQRWSHRPSNLWPLSSDARDVFVFNCCCTGCEVLVSFLCWPFFWQIARDVLCWIMNWFVSNLLTISMLIFETVL